MKANHRDSFRVCGLVLISTLIFVLGALVQPAKASSGKSAHSTPQPTSQPTSQVTPTPGGGGSGGGGGTSIVEVFHFLKFEDSTISDALNIIFG